MRFWSSLLILWIFYEYYIIWMFGNFGVFSNSNLFYLSSASLKSPNKIIFRKNFSDYLVVTMKRMLATDKRRIIKGLIYCNWICSNRNLVINFSKTMKWLMKLATNYINIVMNQSVACMWQQICFVTMMLLNLCIFLLYNYKLETKLYKYIDD